MDCRVKPGNDEECERPYRASPLAAAAISI
jgi:hypothetical protein